ncbi:hypothetical protein AGIG_G7511 [Arapaima gigas]
MVPCNLEVAGLSPWPAVVPLTRRTYLDAHQKALKDPASSCTTSSATMEQTRRLERSAGRFDEYRSGECVGFLTPTPKNKNKPSSCVETASVHAVLKTFKEAKY